MLTEHKRLEEKIKELEKELKTLPEGKLVVAQNGGHYKYYKSDGHKKTYIPKKQRTLAENLAVKKYLSNYLEELLHEKKAIEFYLRHHTTNSGLSEQLFHSPELKELLLPHFIPDSVELANWQKASYDSNPRYPEQLIHKSSSGHKVRSKSEAIIDTFLHLYKIPFRYECALSLDDTILFPDFTIRHPATGETFYWEHFGLMDNPSYTKNAYSKLQLYTSHGIIPSIHLITTFETKSNPLSPKMVKQLIEYYFA